MDFDADHYSCAAPVCWKWCRQQHGHMKSLAQAAAVKAHCIVASDLNFPGITSVKGGGQCAHNCSDNIRQSTQWLYIVM